MTLEPFEQFNQVPNEIFQNNEKCYFQQLAFVLFKMKFSVDVLNNPILGYFSLSQHPRCFGDPGMMLAV